MRQIVSGFGLGAGLLLGFWGAYGLGRHALSTAVENEVHGIAVIAAIGILAAVVLADAAACRTAGPR